VSFVPARLRRGELIAGSSAVLLIVLMVAAPWYGTVDGWNGLTHLRWLELLAVVLALVLVVAQAASRAPALPVSLSVIVTVVADLAFLALVYRVLINPLGHSTEVWAYLGLASALALAWGGYLSMREEGVNDGDAVHEIPTIPLRGS
jgi:Zn-dependent protease